MPVNGLMPGGKLLGPYAVVDIVEVGSGSGVSEGGMGVSVAGIGLGVAVFVEIVGSVLADSPDPNINPDASHERSSTNISGMMRNIFRIRNFTLNVVILQASAYHTANDMLYQTRLAVRLKEPIIGANGPE